MIEVTWYGLDQAEPVMSNRVGPTRVHALKPESNRRLRGFEANYFPNNEQTHLLQLEALTHQ
jgi:hypothetical protein